MKSPQRRMSLRRLRSRGSSRPSQLLLPKSSGHVGRAWVWVVAMVMAVICRREEEASVVCGVAELLTTNKKREEDKDARGPLNFLKIWQ